MVLLYSIGSNPDHSEIDELSLLSVVFELCLQQITLSVFVIKGLTFKIFLYWGGGRTSSCKAVVWGMWITFYLGLV